MTNSPKKYIEDRLDELEEKLARLESENSSLKEQLERHEKIIAHWEEFSRKIVETFGGKKISQSPVGGTQRVSSPPTQRISPVRTSPIIKGPSQQPATAVTFDKFQSSPPDREQPSPPPQSRTQAFNSSQNNLVREFNQLSRIRLRDPVSRQFSNARNNFFREKNCVGLSCSNTNERMNNPKVQAVFSEAQSMQSCDLWVVPIDERHFAALPNPQNVYNDNLHLDRALREVFESNFVEGNIYDKILVDRPAQFERFGGSWIFREQGKLFLE